MRSDDDVADDPGRRGTFAAERKRRGRWRMEETPTISAYHKSINGHQRPFISILTLSFARQSGGCLIPEELLCSICVSLTNPLGTNSWAKILRANTSKPALGCYSPHHFLKIPSSLRIRWGWRSIGRALRASRTRTSLSM